jgi:hypothetical protein
MTRLRNFRNFLAALFVTPCGQKTALLDTLKCALYRCACHTSQVKRVHFYTVYLYCLYRQAPMPKGLIGRLP